MNLVKNIIMAVVVLSFCGFMTFVTYKKATDDPYTDSRNSTHISILDSQGEVIQKYISAGYVDISRGNITFVDKHTGKVIKLVNIPVKLGE